MKYDSYTRFLKSNMYKDCIMSEMEGKSIPYSKHQHVLTNSEDRAKVVESLVRESIRVCLRLRSIVRLDQVERRREERQETKSVVAVDQR